MDTLTVTLNFPQEIISALGVPRSDLEARLQEIIAIELFRDGRISSGKGAELLQISKLEFIQLLARHGVSYFSETPNEMQSDLEAVDALVRAKKS